MEKISGIVKASPRVQAVDMKSASAVRPGAPTFGRPNGVSSLIDKTGLSTAQKAVALHNDIMEHRRATAEEPDIVRNMANKFFMEQEKIADKQVDDFDINDTVIREKFKAAPVTPGKVAKEFQEDLEAASEPDVEKEEWVPPGTYLNVSV